MERISRTDVPKQHAKLFYHVAYNAGREQDKILLDVLFEESHYNNVVTLPITSKFLKEDGEYISLNLPSIEDMLGDKLTAFAPHTTGIPFFKGEKDCSMEINKQLFDIASLFDLVNDPTITANTFKKLAAVELEYRGLNPSNVQTVLDDIYNTSYCITRNGKENADEFKLLLNGISRIRGFIHSEIYTIDIAIVNASKAAYLSRLISRGETKVSHYDPTKIADFADA